MHEAEKTRVRTLAYERYWHATHTTHIQTALFGSNFDNRDRVNWSLSSLQKSGDEAKAENLDLLYRLKKIAEAFDLNTLWAPNPTRFNAIITDKHELGERIPITDTITIFRGAYADGIEIQPGEALILSSGGCPLITMTCKQQVIAAHAGLKCLFDIDTPNRESVVDAMLRRMSYRPSRGTPIEVRVDFSINPTVYDHPWDHPEWGSKNETLCRELYYRWGSDIFVGDFTSGCIDLITLIKQQLRPYAGVTVSEDCVHLDATRGLSHESLRHYHTRMISPYNAMRNLTLTARIQ